MIYPGVIFSVDKCGQCLAFEDYPAPPEEKISFELTIKCPQCDEIVKVAVKEARVAHHRQEITYRQNPQKIYPKKQGNAWTRRLCDTANNVPLGDCPLCLVKIGFVPSIFYYNGNHDTNEVDVTQDRFSGNFHTGGEIEMDGLEKLNTKEE